MPQDTYAGTLQERQSCTFAVTTVTVLRGYSCSHDDFAGSLLIRARVHTECSSRVLYITESAFQVARLTHVGATCFK